MSLMDSQATAPDRTSNLHAATDRAIAALIFTTLYIVYLLTFNGTFRTIDELAMYATTESLAQRGSLSIPQIGFEDFHNPVGMIEPGQALLAVPLYWLAQRFPTVNNIQAVMLLTPLITALTAAILFRIGRTLGYQRGASIAVAFSFGLATIAWPYARSFLREPLMGLLLTLAFYTYAVFRQNGRARWIMVMLGLLLFSLTVKFITVVVAPFFVTPVVIDWISLHPRHKRAAIAVALAVGLIIIAGAVYIALPRYDSSPERITGYLTGFTLTGLWTALYGMLLSPGKGILFYSPVMLAAWLGLLRARGQRWLFVWIAGFAPLAMVLAYGNNPNWFGGQVWGPRFLIPVLPLMVFPLIELLQPDINKPAIPSTTETQRTLSFSSVHSVSRHVTARSPRLRGRLVQERRGLPNPPPRRGLGASLWSNLAEGLRRVAWALIVISFILQIGPVTADWALAHRPLNRISRPFETTIGLDPAYWYLSPAFNQTRFWTVERADLLWAHPQAQSAFNFDPLLPIGLLAILAAAIVLLWRAYRNAPHRAERWVWPVLALAATFLLLARGWANTPDYAGLSLDEARAIATPFAPSQASGHTFVTVSNEFHIFFMLGLMKGDFQHFWFSPAQHSGFEALTTSTNREWPVTLTIDRVHMPPDQSGDEIRNWLNLNAYQFGGGFVGGYERMTYVWGPDPDSLQATRIAFDDVLAIDSAGIGGQTFKPGGVIPIQLALRKVGLLPNPLVMSLRIAGDDGSVIGGHNGPIQFGALDPGQWPVGGTAIDRRGFPIPPDARAGRYRILIGIETLEGLLKTESGEEFAPIGEVQIGP